MFMIDGIGTYFYLKHFLSFPVNGVTVVDRTCAWEQNYGGDPCQASQQSYAYTEHCSVCRYDACNGASGVSPAIWTLAASAVAYFTVKFL